MQIGDRFGNHLALVYNRKLVANPPTTTDELVKLAVASTVDTDGDGRTDHYGLVWNYTEPFFAIPFVTGFGGWVFREPEATPPVPDLNTPAMTAALGFIRDLRDVHKVAPANCDYELADSLFKTGRAAMIVNGDWSWSGLPGESRNRRGGGRAAHGGCHRPAHATDGGSEGLLAQRQRPRRRGGGRDGLRATHGV